MGVVRSLPAKLRARDKSEWEKARGLHGLRGERDRIRLELELTLERAALEESVVGALRLVREWMETGLKRDRRVRMDGAKRIEVLELLAQGWGVPTISKMAGISQKAIHRLKSENN